MRQKMGTCDKQRQDFSLALLTNCYDERNHQQTNDRTDDDNNEQICAEDNISTQIYR